MQYLKGQPYLYDLILKNKLWMVHATDGPHSSKAWETGTEDYSQQGDYDKRYLFRIEYRPILNFAINTLVRPLFEGSIWDCKAFAFVAPMKEFIGELYGGRQNDFVTIAPHTYTDESYLLCPINKVEEIRREFPGIRSTILGFDYDERLKDPDTGFALNRGQCLEMLGNLPGPLASTVEESRTLREAITNLFKQIEREKAVNIWNLPDSLHYRNKARSSSPGMNSRLNFTATSGILLNKNGLGHNIDELLASFNPRVDDPDQSTIQTFTKLIASQKIKRDFEKLFSGEPIPTSYLLDFIDEILNSRNQSDIKPPVFMTNKMNIRCKGKDVDYNNIYSRILDIQSIIRKGLFNDRVKAQLETILSKTENMIYIYFLTRRLLTSRLGPAVQAKLETIYRQFNNEGGNERVNTQFVPLFLRILYETDNRKVLKNITNMYDIQNIKCTGVQQAIKYKIAPNYLKDFAKFRTDFDNIVLQLYTQLMKEAVPPLTVEEIEFIQNHPSDKIAMPGRRIGGSRTRKQKIKRRRHSRKH